MIIKLVFFFSDYFMCLNPKKIVNPAHTFHLGSGQQLYINIPCGHCSECLSQELNEWRLRVKYEALGTSHYVYFDTLTYSDEALPHLSDMLSVPKELDFPCFNKKYVQDFLKRLRSRIHYAGYDDEDGNSPIRYFIASEYGSHNTRRPHHHIALFVNSDIDVRFLSEAVSKSWPYGRTDGLPYKTFTYVNEHNYLPSDSTSIKRVVNYISKYITKDLTFQSLAFKRLQKIKDYDVDLYRNAVPYLCCWHLQSKGFGYNTLLKEFPPEYLAKNLFIPAINSKGAPIHITLPASLIRKAFYCYYRLPFDKNHKMVRFVGNSYLTQFNTNLVKYRVEKLRKKMFVVDSSISYDNCVNILYYHNRLCDDNMGVNDIIKYSSRIGCGLTNYAARDIGLINKRPVITNLDLGTKSSGVQTNFVFAVNDLVDKIGCMFLSEFEKSFAYYDYDCDKFLSAYNKYLAEKGDSQISVQKLLYRLKSIHSKTI